MKDGARIATAYHEAGHAVAALHLGIGLGKGGVSITPDGASMGRAAVLKGFRGRPDLDFNARMRRGIENRVVVLFAGEAAQRFYRPSSMRRYHGAADRECAMVLLDYITGSPDDYGPYVAGLQERARSLVAHPIRWAEINTLAAALLRMEQVSAIDAAAIVNGALCPHPSEA